MADQADGPKQERGNWGSRVEFILSCIGVCVGIGNIWRFPARVYENGGGAFLLPYTLLLFLVGSPLVVLETGAGQFHQLGAHAIAKYAQGSKGLSVAFILTAYFIGAYYNTVMSTTLLYFGLSLTSTLPWSSCDPEWGADSKCIVVSETNITNFTGFEVASSQYYEKYILGGDTEGIHSFGDVGKIQWPLFVASSVSWVIVYICVFNGIKTSGKIVYFTATVPYVLLIVLFFGNVFQSGAMNGIKYFFVPNWEGFSKPKVWKEAIEQMFFSLSLGWSGLMMFGSYNKFSYKLLVKDILFITVLDTITSIMGGMVIFSVLGSWAERLNVDVGDVVSKGAGLAFKVYPEAVMSLPAPPFWSCAFFLLLYLLGLDSEFGLMEACCTYIYDAWPKTRKYKWLVSGLICLSGFIVSIPLCFSKGGSIVELMDNYSGIPLMLLSLLEDIIISFFYGVDNFLNDIQFMCHTKMYVYWKLCLGFFVPVALVASLVAFYASYESPHQINGDEFPVWMHVIGWLAAMSTIFSVFVGFIVTFIQLKKAKKPLKNAFKEAEDFEPGDPEFSAKYKQFRASEYEKKKFIPLVQRRSKPVVDA